jgi:choline-glycine betaine transporter
MKWHVVFYIFLGLPFLYVLVMNVAAAWKWLRAPHPSEREQRAAYMRAHLNSLFD